MNEDVPNEHNYGFSEEINEFLWEHKDKIYEFWQSSRGNLEPYIDGEQSIEDEHDWRMILALSTRSMTPLGLDISVKPGEEDGFDVYIRSRAGEDNVSTDKILLLTRPTKEQALLDALETLGEVSRRCDREIVDDFINRHRRGLESACEIFVLEGESNNNFARNTESQMKSSIRSVNAYLSRHGMAFQIDEEEGHYVVYAGVLKSAGQVGVVGDDSIQLGRGYSIEEAVRDSLESLAYEMDHSELLKMIEESRDEANHTVSSVHNISKLFQESEMARKEFEASWKEIERGVMDIEDTGEEAVDSWFVYIQEILGREEFQVIEMEENGITNIYIHSFMNETRTLLSSGSDIGTAVYNLLLGMFYEGFVSRNVLDRFLNQISIKSEDPDSD